MSRQNDGSSDNEEVQETEATRRARLSLSSGSGSSSRSASVRSRSGSDGNDDNAWTDETAVLAHLDSLPFEQPGIKHMKDLATREQITLREAQDWGSYVLASSKATMDLPDAGAISTIKYPVDICQCMQLLSALTQLPSSKRMRAPAAPRAAPKISISVGNIKKLIANAWWGDGWVGFSSPKKTLSDSIMATLRTTPTHVNADPVLAELAWKDADTIKKIEDTVSNGLADIRSNTKAALAKSMDYTKDPPENKTSLTTLGTALFTQHSITPTRNTWTLLCLLRFWMQNGKAALLENGKSRKDYWKDVDRQIGKLKRDIKAGGEAAAKRKKNIKTIIMNDLSGHPCDVNYLGDGEFMGSLLHHEEEEEEE